jgi:2-phosphosulfolactate phosphatase
MHVHKLPRLIAPSILKGSAAVIIDVLRATTLLTTALAAGVEQIIPCLEIEEARAVAAGFPKGTAFLGGERQGELIEGFLIGNSPSSCTPELCRGRTLVLTTTNGTRAIHASLEAEVLLIGAFVNLAAVLERLLALPNPVHLVCAGTDGYESLEDELFAGAVVDRLVRIREVELDPIAMDVQSQWTEAEAKMQAGEALAHILSQGRGGKRVTELGLAADIEDAATIDRYSIVGQVVRDPLRIVRS